MSHWNKQLNSLRVFSDLNSSLLRKQRYEQKKPLPFCFTLQFIWQKVLQILSRVSFPASKFTPIKMILEKIFSSTLLRAAKKTAPQYNLKTFSCSNLKKNI